MKIIRFKDIDYLPASHEDPQNPGVLKKVLFTHQDLIMGKIMMINWAKLAPNKSFEPHYHEDMMEVFIIIKGKVKMRVGTDEEILTKGDGVIVPIKAVHEMTNLARKSSYYFAMGISLEQGGKTINQ